MKFSTSKTTATAVSLFLMFAMAVSLVALPAAIAQPTRETFAYLGAVPNPVGVGQEVLLHVGITQQLSSTLYSWEGLTVEVTRPDGTKETLGPVNTDSTGGTGYVYTPGQVGNYTLQTHFPEQVCEEGVIGFGTTIVPGTVMLASDSEELTLVVQEEPRPFYPGVPLPTEYWTRPIDSQYREWSSIAGSWLIPSGVWQSQPEIMNAPYNNYAPETAHVLWTTPLTSGGLVGGALGEHSYEIGDAYEGKFIGSIIIGGKLYYEKYATADRYKEIACVDLHTGEQLWSRVLLNNQTIAFGQVMYWDSYDYHGVYDYLWTTVGTTWNAFDPFNGDYVYTLTDVPPYAAGYTIPTCTSVYGPNGEILIYTVNLANGYMTMWNSTNIPELYASTNYGSMGWGQWRPMGKTINATGPAGVTIGGGMFGFPPPDPYIAPTTPLGLNGYQWNKTIPTGLTGGVIAAFEDRIIGGRINNTAVDLWGLSLESGREGTLLFKNTWDAPDYWIACDVGAFSGGGFGGGGFYGGWAGYSSEDKVIVNWVKETREFYAFSLDTGKLLWGPSEPEEYMSAYCRNTAIAYGKLFATGSSGIVHAYDINTGEQLWTYEAKDFYNEILWANDWWSRINFVTDGKVYVAYEEHSPIDPRFRGGPYYCLNATTGEEIWRVNGMFRQTEWGGRSIIGDSIIAAMDTYDQRIYAIGKGPSATTVTASPKVSVHGDNVLVEGMVTDISPSTKEYSLTARFPNGVPAVADENMSDWMLYVYKQSARPADVVGVEVVIEVLDPNTNYYEVGRATSDASGGFKLMFTPEVPGEYTIIATFEGSEGYWPSYAQTYLGVEEAPAATPAPMPTPAPMTDTYVMGFGIGMIIAIVVVGLLLFLLLRKR
jgi:outer membrane protein assembly factor BamB